MKINLEKCQYKNFLSIGASPVIIDNITKFHTTLVTGRNGAAKSSFMDALMFALYGKPYRDVNKNQLINSINKKGCLVELWFNIDNKTEYYIKRGIKPNIFLIEKDGVELEEEAGVRDYQKILETEILKMTYKTAKQIVALGTAGFTPFMQLKTYERRGIIDDLLDIEVFSVMAENNKKQESVVTQTLDGFIQQLQYNEREITVRKQYIADNKKDKNKQIDAVQQKIEQFNELVANAHAKIIKKTEDINKLDLLIKPFSKEQLSQLFTDRTTLELEIKGIKKGIRFFEEYCKCPTCKQKIDADFIKAKIDQYNNELNVATKQMETLQDNIKGIESIKERNTKILIKKTELQESISTLNLHIKAWEDSTKKYDIEIEDLKNEHDSIDLSELQNLTSTSKALLASKKQVLNKKYCHNKTALVLKDNGIKARIISQYIPIINQLINNYLGIMDANYKFELDSEFNEKILSRGREEFSYMSFSQGEKMRIDLAILFTWRELIKLKNAATFNILIMDEIMDSAADQDGVDCIMKIINDLKDNVYIISHNDKIDATSFDNHINMVKVGNFSCIDKTNV